MSERSFKLPNQRGVIRISKDVLNHTYRYTQTNIWKTEAGGQLFTKTPESADILISEATGPYPSDKRSRYGFHPDPNIANRDRKKKFSYGYHAVGLWHTHPERIPFPSERDRETTSEYLEAFDGEMDAFILLIIGNRGSPPNICIWMASIDPDLPWVKLDEL